MKEYHKIETLFEFDMKTKKFKNNVFNNKTVELLKNHLWEFTEKVDGTNFRIHWDGHKLTYGGRTSASEFNSEQIEFIEQNLVNEDMEILIEQKFKDKEVTIFGELYGKKIQKVGNLYNPDNYEFKVFDIYLPIKEKPISNKYVNRIVVNSIAKDLGFDVVPVILIGNIEEAISYVMKNDKSTFSEAPLEGLVGVPKGNLLDENGERIIIKIKKRDLLKSI